ncbi:hypothetical protein LTR12_014853 [Friedmanniomyces endolithicus]|nr:hypothetical protein LTR12_014853 [Friedmanniomyces endolithicus]
MAPSLITEDYYMALEVTQTATSELITKSYRRLALKVHLDRNAKDGSTQAFQLLALAYETLKDEGRRQEYNLIYPSITRSRASPQSTQTPRPPPVSAPHPEALREAARIAVVRKTKEERGARWSVTRHAFEWSIFELQRSIRRVEQDMKNLASTAAAEAAVKARKNSWGTWFLSPLYKQVDESEDEKARKDRGRQERRIEKDLKERRLGLQQAQLREKESLLKQAKEYVDTADLCSDRTIRAIENRTRDREAGERLEKEKVEEERLARIWKQQQEQREKQAQEAREVLRKQQAEPRAAEFARQEENRRLQKVFVDEMERRQRNNVHSSFDHGTTRQAYASACSHDGWWDKVQGRTACPKCYHVWNYLLQCPSCETKACPKCQSELRPRVPRNTTRTSRREPPRPGYLGPHYYYDD